MGEPYLMEEVGLLWWLCIFKDFLSVTKFFKLVFYVWSELIFLDITCFIIILLACRLCVVESNTNKIWAKEQTFRNIWSSSGSWQSFANFGVSLADVVQVAGSIHLWINYKYTKIFSIVGKVPVWNLIRLLSVSLLTPFSTSLKQTVFRNTGIVVTCSADYCKNFIQ